MTIFPAQNNGLPVLYRLEIEVVELAHDCRQQIDALVLLAAASPGGRDLGMSAQSWYHLLSPLAERLQWLAILLEKGQKAAQINLIANKSAD